MLKIFDTDTAEGAKRRNQFADDIVGRFRSGYQVSGRPASLNAWRVTTGDPDVADAIKEALGGDDVQEWEATGEDYLEVFTTTNTVNIIIESDKALRQRMVLRNRNGQIIRSGDGAVIDYPEDQAGQPDPQAGQTFAERKAAAKEGMGAVPEVSLTFRLADDPDLGLFRFQSSSWSFVSDINYWGIDEDISDYDGPVRATLGLEEVSFVAKSGPQKGKTIRYTKPLLKVKGAATVAAA